MIASQNGRSNGISRIYTMTPTWKLIRWVAALLLVGVALALADEFLVPLLPLNW